MIPTVEATWYAIREINDRLILSTAAKALPSKELTSVSTLVRSK